MKIRIFISLLCLLVLLFAFQNCGNGMKANLVSQASLNSPLPQPTLTPPQSLNFNFADTQLKADRNLVKNYYIKSCYCIECSKSETEKAIALGCTAIHWGAVGWIAFSNMRGPYSGGSKESIRQEIENYFSNLKERTHLANQQNVIFEGGITEIVSDPITLLELEDFEIDDMNKLTEIYGRNADGQLRFPLLDKNLPEDRKIFSNFHQLISWTDPIGETSLYGAGKPTELFRWWGPDPNYTLKGYYYNGIPNLQTREGWYYHIWRAIRDLRAGVTGFGISQLNLRFHAGANGGSSEEKTHIVIQFLKAIRAYHLALNNKKLIIESESVGPFGNALLPYLDYIKYMADTDLAHQGQVLTTNTNNLSCLQKNYAWGFVTDNNDFRTGPLCLADNGNSTSVRLWNQYVGPNPNFQIYSAAQSEEFNVAYSIELDGCQACGFPSSPTSGISVPFYKTIGTQGDTVCAAKIRNGLSTTQQYIGQPPQVRREFLKYMDKTSKQLSEKYGRTIFFSQLLKVDQNMTMTLDHYLAGQPEKLAYQKLRVRYCPNSLSDVGITSGSYFNEAIYFAEECGDHHTIKDILMENSNAFRTRTARQFVTEAYQKILLRLPESESALNQHINTCRNSELSIWLGGFLSSTESLQKLTNRATVARTLYQFLLLREPAQHEVDAWAGWSPGLAETAWRQAISTEFSQSAEFRSKHFILGCEL